MRVAHPKRLVAVQCWRVHLALLQDLGRAHRAGRATVGRGARLCAAGGGWCFLGSIGSRQTPTTRQTTSCTCTFGKTTWPWSSSRTKSTPCASSFRSSARCGCGLLVAAAAAAALAMTQPPRHAASTGRGRVPEQVPAQVMDGQPRVRWVAAAAAERRRGMTDGPHCAFVGWLVGWRHRDMPFPRLAELLAKYQNPAEADSMTRVQQDLDETKDILVRPAGLMRAERACWLFTWRVRGHGRSGRPWRRCWTAARRSTTWSSGRTSSVPRCAWLLGLGLGLPSLPAHPMSLCCLASRKCSTARPRKPTRAA